MRIESDQLSCAIGIERKIQRGADTDLQYSPASERQKPLSIRHELTVAHRKVYEMWQDAILVESHAFSERIVHPSAPQGSQPST